MVEKLQKYALNKYKEEILTHMPSLSVHGAKFLPLGIMKL